MVIKSHLQNKNKDNKENNVVISEPVFVSNKEIPGTHSIRRIFLGLTFSTPVFFWLEDLIVYLFGSEKSARIF